MNDRFAHRPCRSMVTEVMQLVKMILQHPFYNIAKAPCQKIVRCELYSIISMIWILITYDIDDHVSGSLYL